MRKKFLYVLFPLLFITFGTSAQRTTVIKATDNIQPVTVNSIDGVGWADAIVTSPTTGNIYWTYIASNFDAVIVKIEPGGTTTSHVLEDVGSIPDNNNHAEVCLSIDSEGYLHWMGGHHNSSPNYYRSSNPEDITSWDFYGNDLANGGMQGDRITYQNFFRANDGTLFVAYRNNFLDQFSYMGMRSIFLGRYDVNTEKWTFFGGLDYELTYINSSTCNDPTTGEEDIQMNAFVWENTGVGDGTTCPSTGHYQGYQLKVAFDEDNGMHVTYNMAYNINSDYNDLANNDPSKMMTHVFYAYSPDLGDTWYKADGTQITHFPMGIDDGDLVYSRYPDGYTYPDLAPHYNMSNGIYIVIDANGDPAINQTVFSAGNLASEKFFKWDGSQWADVSNDIVFDDLTNAHTSFDRDETYSFGFGGVFNISSDNMASEISYQLLPTSNTVLSVDRQFLRTDNKLRFYQRTGDKAKVMTYEILTGAASPDIQPEGIVQPGDFQVTLTSETTGAQIRYTTDGTDPNSEYGEVYSGPFSVSEDLEIRAVAYKDGLPTSMVTKREYKLAPSFTTKANIQSVSASDAQSPNVAANAVDGDFFSRWSADGDQWLQFDLGQVEDIYSIYIAFIRGDQRKAKFDIQVSDDGSTWTTVKSSVESSGETLDYEEFLVEASGRYLRYNGHGNSSSTWNSIAEAEIWLGDAEPTTVTINPEGGEYDGEEEVTLSSTVTGLDIYYTLDGSEPTSSSTLYTGTFNINGPHAIVKAAGIDDDNGYYEYPPAEAEYYQTLAVAEVATAPTIDGTKDDLFTSGSPVQNLVFGASQWDDDNDLSGTIYVTADDDNLYIFAEVKDDNIKDDSDETYQDDGLELFFDKGNDKDSDFGSDDFYYGFKASGDDFTEYQKGSVNGVEYAVSTVTGGYNMEIKIPFLALGITDAKGKAIGFDATLIDDDDGGDYAESKMSWYNFSNNSAKSPKDWGTIIVESNKVLDPVLDPAGGSYSGGTNVEISSATPGASIRYTTNGSIPTPTTGIEYTSGNKVSVRASETIKAIAYKDGKENSKVVSATYTITDPPSADLEIEKTATAPTIDASIEGAWDIATAVSCSNVTTGTVSNDDDLSGTFKVMWDDDNFYLLAEVTDDIASNDDDEGGDDEKPWKDDGIEFFIDIGNDKATSYGTDDYQYGFERDGTGMIEYKNSAESGVTWAASSITGSYVIEVSIPWSTLGTTPDEFTMFGFDINLVDHDDAGTSIDGKKAWYNTEDVAYEDPSTLADAKLKGAPLPWTLSFDNNTNGSISLSPAGGSYADDEVVHASVIGNSGYGFDHWTGNVAAANENDNPVAITMDADKSITANYIAVSTYSINTSTGGSGSGSIEVDPASGPYNAGTMVLVTAKPDAGNDFDGWTGSVTNSNEQIIVEMDAVKNLTANFEPGTSPVIELTVNSGSGSDIGLAEGEEVTINADDAPAKYRFSKWTGDVAFVEDVNSALTTVTMPDVSISVTANYEAIPEDMMLFVDQNHADASDASDQSGTEDEPFLTIQRAANVAQPGQYVYIKAGTYRETIVPVTSGLNGQPITYLAYGSDEVTVSGAEEMTGWTHVEGNIYKTAMAKDFIEYDQGFTDQVFVNGQMINIARWPNTSLDVSYPKKAQVNSASRSGSGPYTGTIDSKLTPPSGDYSTAGIFFWPDSGKWTWSFTGRVQSVSGNEVIFESTNGSTENNGTDYTSDARYFLFGSRNLLDTEGEWYHDTVNNELYIWIPGGGDPSTATVEAKKRNFGFDLSNKNYITIKGLNIFATTVTMDNKAGTYNGTYNLDGTHNASGSPWKTDDDPVATASNNVLDGLDVKYPTHSLNQEFHFFTQHGMHSGIVLAGYDHVVKNCSIQYASDNGISCIGYGHKILNNYIADVAYYGRDYAAIGSGNKFAQTAADQEYGYNTITRCGRSGILGRNFANSDANNPVARIHHNDISHFMLQDGDGAAIYIVSMDGKFARVDHNYIHNGSKAWLVGGVYYDYSKNYVTDHNVIKDVWGSVMLTKSLDDAGVSNFIIYNNTLLCRDIVETFGNGPFNIPTLGDQDGAILRNNIMSLSTENYTNYRAIQFADKFDEGAVSHNQEDTLGNVVNFADYPTDLSPVSTSTKLIDQGILIDEITREGTTIKAYNDLIAGSAPDIGAYEYGMPKFKAGKTDDDVVKYNLVVTSGSGTGSYEEDANVAISANSISGKTFTEWTGDVSHVADVNSATTTVTMPAQAIAVTATYEEAACTDPDAPTQNEPTAGDGQVTVNWNTVSGADGYNVKYGTSSGSYGTTETVSGGSSTSTTITELTNGTTYYFVVTATDGACESGNSGEKNAKPEASVVTQYTLTTSADPTDGGSVSPSGSNDYDEDTDVEVIATANTGYNFDGWDGASTETNNTITVTMDADKSLTAQFSLKTYTLTTDVNNSSYGSVSVDPDQTSYDHGTEVTIIATPASGYQFDDWTGSSETNDTITITMDSDKSITANFSAGETETNLALNKDVTFSGFESPNDNLVDGDISDGSRWSQNTFPEWAEVDLGQDCNITKFEVYPYQDRAYQYKIEVKPDGGSYSQVVDRLSNTTGGNIIMDEVTTSGRYVKITVEGASGYTGSWVSLNELMVFGTTGATPSTYTLTTSADPIDGGSVSPSGSNDYDEDTDVEVIATANTGYNFDGWDGASTETNNTITVTMDSDKSLTAQFSLKTYTLTTDVNNSSYGSVSVDPDQASYDHGTEVTVIATPASGYQFDDWTGSSETNDTITITMDSDKSLTANFSAETVQYTLTTSADPTDGGSVSPSGSNDYDEDTDVEVIATANTGYNFDGWDGASSETNDTITVTMDSDKSLTANFSPILVSSISIPEGDQSKQVGDADFTLTVNVSPGDALDKSVTWDSDSESVATVTSGGVVSVIAAGTANITATANDGSGANDAITVTVTDPSPGEESLTAAFAFGADSYTTETPNESGTNYVKVVQNGANFTYSSSQGHGYTETSDIDGSANNRNSTPCGEELYDQFIGVKSGGEIIFRVDVPNGDYQFVAVMGDASYSHTNTMKVRDGSTGTTHTLIDNVNCASDEYATVTFGDKTIIPCSGATFTAQPESQTLTVTNGYIDVIQSTPNTGGDLVLVEIWSTDGGTTTPTDTIQAEDFTSMSGITTQDGISGYNGTGYVDYGGNGTWAEWVYNAASSGTVTVDLRYTNGSSTRPLAITVDGVSNGSFNCVNTGDWYTWTYISEDITVSAGDNTIKLTADPNQGPNIDELVFRDLRSSKASGDLLTDAASVKLFPNPTSVGQGFTLELKGFENEANATVSIMDISGRTTFSTVVQTRHAFSRSLDIGSLSSGMYMVTVRSGNKVINNRLIVK